MVRNDPSRIPAGAGRGRRMATTAGVSFLVTVHPGGVNCHEEGDDRVFDRQTAPLNTVYPNHTEPECTPL